jgi:hypothetical protein
MSRWRPSPDEERWLAVASELGAAVPPAVFTARTGGWRSTGPLARIALFALGFVAAVLVFGILGFSSEPMLLTAGLITTLAAEWLTVRKRLYASGIEEGLSVAGALLIGLWFAIEVAPEPLFMDGNFHVLVLIVAAGAAGLRRLNPLVTTGAVIAFVSWVGSTATARTLDHAIGGELTALVFGCSLAALALILGAREYRRPSHDRMLDWLVATLPFAAYAQQVNLEPLDRTYAASGTGTTQLVTIVLLLALAAAMLTAGLRRRRHAPLWGFMGCIVGLAVELRASIALAPETWLIVCGLVALIVGVALDRYLRQPRNGLTSASLTRREGPLDLLQIAGTALLAQRPVSELQTQPQSATAGFEGGGGKFGGGGARGRY